MTDSQPAPLSLSSGRSTAVVHPSIGGRLGQLDLGDGPILRGHAAGLGGLDWGCYPLIPWSNRLPGGTLRFDGIVDELPVNHPDGSAIHGLAASCPWSVVERTERRVELVVDLHGGPYDVRGAQSYELSDGRLDLRVRATNIGARAVPVGIGIHPWFPAGPIQVPAARRWPGEPLPTGPPVEVAGRYDLRAPTVAAPMDTCFTGLTRTWADVPGARLGWEGPVTHVVVFSGRPGWVCVEPVTMANDGIALAEAGKEGHGVQVLAPGGSLEVAYSFERTSDGSGADLARLGRAQNSRSSM